MVNKNIIEKTLSTITTNIRELELASDIDWTKYCSDIRSKRFVERTLHVIIEACLDVAQHIIAEEGFREPSTYRDSFTILCEEGIIPKEKQEIYEKIAMFRNLIVHHYEKVDDSIVFGIFKKNLEDFKNFVQYLLEYLQRKKD